MTKSELRKAYLNRRNALSSAERADKSRKIAELFFENVDLTDISVLHCFISIDKFNEVDTSLITNEIWSRYPHVVIAVPRVHPETDKIESLVYDSEACLIKGSWGTLEPLEGSQVDPAKIDVVLVPLICFDEFGFRVGYGKGYYDRLLALCRPDCLKIGLSFFAPITRIEDVHGWDIPLDQCVTPDALFIITSTDRRLIA